MLGCAFVNVSLHYTLACWRKIGAIDTNKGTMVTIYCVTSKDSHFTDHVLSDNISGSLADFAPIIKTARRLF